MQQQPPPDRKYTRGMFTYKTPWSNDTSEGYFKGAHMQVYWPLAKMGVLGLQIYLIVSVLQLPGWVAFVACLVSILYYQDLIAAIKGYKRMKSLDV